MKKIPLSKGMFTIVDDEDFAMVGRYKWYCDSMGYARRTEWKDKVRVNIILSRFLLSAPKSLRVDHINGNKLDNRKTNLRLVTTQQNGYNRKKHVRTRSKYKGVGYDPECTFRPWKATIYPNNKCVFLGNFATEKEAALAYDIAAKKYFGEYARLNLSPHHLSSLYLH